MVEMDVGNVTFEIKQSGVVDLDKLYKDMQKWFSDREYTFHEKVHKFKPPELELSWEGKRKDNGYRMITITMDFHSWYHKDVTVKQEGKEKKMVDARFQIFLNTFVTYDYNNSFDTPFKEWIQKFLHEVILRYYINIVWPDKAYYELVDLQKVIKLSLDSTLKEGAF